MLTGATSSNRPLPDVGEEQGYPPISLLEHAEFDDDDVISSWSEPVVAPSVPAPPPGSQPTSHSPAPSHVDVNVISDLVAHVGHEVPTAVKTNKDGVVVVMQPPTLDAMLHGRRGKFA